ncbi:MAG: hypothetical protein AAGK32_05110, partial [Actinomycetota bacterium]
VTVDPVEGYEQLGEAGVPGVAGGMATAGPNRDLVGSSIADLSLGDPMDLEPRLDLPVGGFDVESGSATLPAYVHVVYEGEPVGEVAVALDGEIVAVVPSYDAGTGFADVSAVLPPDLLTPGAHEVGLFVVVGDGDDRALRPLGRF